VPGTDDLNTKGAQIGPLFPARYIQRKRLPYLLFRYRNLLHRDRKLGRRLSDLISILQTLDANGVGFYSHAERLDSSMAGSIFEFAGLLQGYEWSQRRERCIAGQQRSRGLLGTRMARPPIPQAKVHRIRMALEAGGKIRPIARQFFVSATTVLSVKKSLVRDAMEPEAEAA